MVSEDIPSDVRGLHRKVRELIREVNRNKIIGVQIHTQTMDVNGVAVPIPSTNWRPEVTDSGTIIVLEP